MAIGLHYAARSDVGLIRSNNQDSGYAGPHLLVVADGMGGHAGGDIASSLAVAELAPLDGESLGSQEAQGRLTRALQSANARLLDRVSVEPQLSGMGTTVTAVLRAGSRLILAHIGDSRAYLLRDGELSQLTADHTYVQRLVEEGSITVEEAEQHPQRSVLLRVLTGEHGDEADLSVREARPGDRLLLCSDGLSGVVSHETIHDSLADGGTPAETAERLVKLALRAGGPDNVTVIIADVVELNRSPSTSPQVVGSAAGRMPEDDEREAAGRDSAAQRAALLVRPSDQTDSHPPAARRRRFGPWTVLVVAGLVLLLGGGTAAGWSWLRSQYYIGTGESDGTTVVAIYRGLNSDIAGVPASTLVELTDIPLSDLPQFQQEALEQSIAVPDLDTARQRVAGLEAEAAENREAPSQAEPTAEPTATPQVTPSEANPAPPPAPAGASAVPT